MNKTYVNPVSSASKTGSHPNLGGPRAGTIFPSVQPSNKTGSVPPICQRVRRIIRVAHQARPSTNQSEELTTSAARWHFSMAISCIVSHKSWSRCHRSSLGSSSYCILPSYQSYASLHTKQNPKKLVVVRINDGFFWNWHLRESIGT